MNAIAALANCAWLSASVPALARFSRSLHRPEAAQAQILHRLLSDNSATAYGKRHRFHEIRSYEQFRDSVPVVEYEDLAPWISRIMHGEQRVLTRELVTRLLPTSGSTGGRKLIPFTTSLQREFNAAISPWMLDIARTYPSVPLGPSYWSISPAIPKPTGEHSAVPIGFDDDSAYLGGFRRRLVEATFAVPSAARLVHDTEGFRYVTLLSLLRCRDLRLVSVWHPSFLRLLVDALPQWWPELTHDIETGACSAPSPIPAEVRKAVRSSPQPARARELRECAPLEPARIWPYLSLVSCWGDGQATLALGELKARIPTMEIQAKGLLATEAFVSIPFCGLHPLAVISHFLEFEDEHGNVRRAHELCRGEQYSVIVTTSGGLWRYRLGDLVEVDGYLGETPSIRFIGRGSSVSDVCGEKLAETFVTQALGHACVQSSFTPRFAMLAPEIQNGGRYSYTLFLEGIPPEGFIERLDQELRENPHYALCRALQQLEPLQYLQIASDGYEVFCKVATAEGKRLGDVKPVHLSSRTDWRSHFNAAALAS